LPRRRLVWPQKTRLRLDRDVALAFGALLVRLARADGEYDPGEIAQIDAILRARYGLGDADAAQLRARCEIAEAEAPDTVRFTKAIKEAVPYEDRESVIEAMWSVVLSDGERDQHENALLRMIAPLLGISDQVSHQIRQKLERS